MGDDVRFELLVMLEGEFVVFKSVGQQRERQLGRAAAAVTPLEAAGMVLKVSPFSDRTALVALVSDDGTLAVDALALVPNGGFPSANRRRARPRTKLLRGLTFRSSFLRLAGFCVLAGEGQRRS